MNIEDLGRIPNLNLERLRPKSEEERQRVMERTKQYISTPFQDLPGHPPTDKVVGILPDGFKVRTFHAETVYNDWLMIDFVYGDGHYEKYGSPRECEILALAKSLYAAKADS